MLTYYLIEDGLSSWDNKKMRKLENVIKKR